MTLTAEDTTLRVIDFLRDRPKTIGATCDEIEEHLGLSHFEALDALTDLKKHGAIREIQHVDGGVYTRFTRAGGLGVCWTLVRHRY